MTLLQKGILSRIFIGYLVLGAGAIVLVNLVKQYQIQQLENSPFDHYVEYHNLTSVTPDHEPGEEFIFLSDVEYHRLPKSIRWTEVISCDHSNDDDEHFVTFAKSESLSIPSKLGRRMVEWKFRDASSKPITGPSESEAPAACVLTSKMEIEIDRGVILTQSVNTPIFYFGDW